MIHCPGTEQVSENFHFTRYLLNLSHTNNTLSFKTLPKWSGENFIPISKHAILFEELHFLTPSEETQN